MIVFHSIDEDLKTQGPLSIALGTFDGIHIGHRKILESAVNEATKRGIRSACYCFSNLPKEFLFSKSGNLSFNLTRLCSEEEKMKLLEGLGFDYVFSVPFDERTMSVPAEKFIRDTLIDKLHAEVICCGFNYTFGKGAEGDTVLLTDIAAQYGVDVKVQDPVYYEGRLVSSTAIRSLFESGNRDLAYKMLGR